MNQGSFCSGVGGLDIGVAQVFGSSHAWFCEHDKGASTVLSTRFVAG